MNVQIINGLPRTTSMTPAMKMNKAAANTFEHTENKQQALINTEFLNNNNFKTDQLISWHLNIAASVIMGLMIFFAYFHMASLQEEEYKKEMYLYKFETMSSYRRNI